MNEDSIDNVDYRVEWRDGGMVIEPGADRVVSASEFYGAMLYFTERSVYRMPLDDRYRKGRRAVAVSQSTEQSGGDDTSGPILAPLERGSGK